MRSIIPITFLLMMAVIGCDEASKAKPALGAAPATNPAAMDVASIGRTYKTFRMMTPGAVPVSQAISLLCAPAGARPAQSKFDTDTRAAHGTKVTIFMNESAAEAFSNNRSAYPAGSVIVKQKEALGVGGMVKR